MPLLSATNRFQLAIYLLGSLLFFSLPSPVFAESAIKPDAPAKPAGLPPVELEQAAPKSGISFKTRPLNSLNTSESFRSLDKPANPPSAEKPNMEDYLATVNKHLQNHWHPPRLIGCDDKQTEPCTVITQVTIGRQGELVGSKHLKASTVPSLNQAALDGILLSFPFPPLPASYPNPTLDLKCKFVHNQSVSIQLMKADTSSSLAEDEVDFSDYIRYLQRKIRSNWRFPVTDTNARVVTRFNIDKQGQMSELKVIGPSPDPRRNLAAENAIRASAPFPPLPAQYKYPDITVQFIFDFEAYSSGSSKRISGPQSRQGRNFRMPVFWF